MDLGLSDEELEKRMYRGKTAEEFAEDFLNSIRPHGKGYDEEDCKEFAKVLMRENRKAVVAIEEVYGDGKAYKIIVKTLLEGRYDLNGERILVCDCGKEIYKNGKCKDCYNEDLRLWVLDENYNNERECD